MNMSRRDQIAGSMKSKSYRDLYVEENINTAIAFQIRATRERRGWSQKELGERTGMAQSRICRLEDPDYGNYTLNTLRKLASALDVGLLVSFAPFSEVLDRVETLTPESLGVPRYEEDSVLLQPSGIR